jgi:hypothetical protein
VGPIAQSVEQRTFNPWVDGSSPSGPTGFLFLNDLNSRLIMKITFALSRPEFLGSIPKHFNQNLQLDLLKEIELAQESKLSRKGAHSCL